MSRSAQRADRRGRHSAELAVSRSLLFPGPMAPLSHLGATLLRHAVASGLRYALYQLGLPPPDKPPVRIHRLRLYLDGQELARHLAEQPGGSAAVAALIDPGGPAFAGREATPVAAANRPSEGAAQPASQAGLAATWRLTGAAAFQRLRLRLTPRPRTRPMLLARADCARFRAALSRRLPALNDAFLGELLASLARRDQRTGGRRPAPCLSTEAWKWSAGRRARLDHLGPPDLRDPSWASAPPDPLASRSQHTLPARRHPHRGRFRERYRSTLDALRPAFLEIAERAARRGVLQSADDAFFLPFDLADDLELETPPAWLGPAVATNRREYEALLAAPSPPDILTGSVSSPGRRNERSVWARQPLALLL